MYDWAERPDKGAILWWRSGEFNAEFKARVVRAALCEDKTPAEPARRSPTDSHGMLYLRAVLHMGEANENSVA